MTASQRRLQRDKWGLISGMATSNRTGWGQKANLLQLVVVSALIVISKAFGKTDELVSA